MMTRPSMRVMAAAASLSPTRAIRAMKSTLPVTLTLLAACGGFETSAPVAGVRLITGQLEPPDPALFTRGQVALQLAAAELDAREEPALVSLVLGAAFNPSAQSGDPTRFRLAVPADRSFVLFFQVPVDNGVRLGRLAARVRFPRGASGDLTDLVGGRGSDTGLSTDLDLGVVKIAASGTSETGVSYVAVLGEDRSINPLAQNDVDGDGVPDVDDADDDDDLIPDEGDTDANGDDIPDEAQTLDALPDDDADLTPDLFEG